tara:strand:- start:3760 stop:4707 length:948 start_codon:yes stop_codon:yes gene_type:complete
MILAGSSDPGSIKYLKYLQNKSPIKIKIINDTQLLKKIKIPFKYDLILTGAALGNSIDRKLIRLGKQNKVCTISIIENWTNLNKRFLYRNNYLYPDNIFVNDNSIKKKLIKYGCNSRIYICGNILLEKIVLGNITNNFLNKIKYNKRNKKKALFISQPLTEDFKNKTKKYLGFTEHEVIKYISKKITPYWSLTIKTHPRDKINKYNYINNKTIVTNKISFEKMLSNYDIIIGMNSMLLLELSLLRNRVFSYEPNAKFEFVGKQLKLIEDLSDLITDKKFLISFPKIRTKYDYPFLKKSLNRTLETLIKIHTRIVK